MMINYHNRWAIAAGKCSHCCCWYSRQILRDILAVFSCCTWNIKSIFHEYVNKHCLLRCRGQLDRPFCWWYIATSGCINACIYWVFSVGLSQMYFVTHWNSHNFVHDLCFYFCCPVYNIFHLLVLCQLYSYWRMCNCFNDVYFHAACWLIHF